jgi:hypothetical protein
LREEAFRVSLLDFTNGAAREVNNLLTTHSARKKKNHCLPPALTPLPKKFSRKKKEKFKQQQTIESRRFHSTEGKKKNKASQTIEERAKDEKMTLTPRHLFARKQEKLLLLFLLLLLLCFLGDEDGERFIFLSQH